MNRYKYLKDALAHLRGRLTLDAPLEKITWLRVGGPADVLYQPADEEDLSDFLKTIPEDMPVTVIGVGSNILVRDGGIRGAVIRLSAKGFGKVEQVSPTRLLVGAAATDRRIAAAALDASIGGFAFYHGIPGAMGGALRMNAGANGTETSQRVREVMALNRQGERVKLNLSDMGYSYRNSRIGNDLIFTFTLLEGVHEERETIQAEMDAVQLHRESAQPVKEKTGGSTFKNPEGFSAWKLVDQAGLRGFKVGDAMMSEMHCNFMINTGNATAYDLEKLGETVRERVYKKTNVLLQWEIKRLGSFNEGWEVPSFNAV